MSAPNAEDEADYWLELALGDLIAGRELTANAAVPPRCAAFFAHQAAETALKAIVAHGGAEPPRTHDLVRLAQQCRASVTLEVTLDDLRSLTDVHIQAQYLDSAVSPYAADDVGSMLVVASSVVSAAQRAIRA
jgi:HEPN domain-containing protein